MKKVSSVVWQFFDRLEENNRCVSVLCKLCDCEYKYFGNTTNLRVHLIKKHPIQWELRQSNNWDGQKPLVESGFDDESTNQSTLSPKRRKYARLHKDKNVCYSLSVNTQDRGKPGTDSMPKIEIKRVDILEHSETETDQREHEDNEATINLVRQIHNPGSDEEWLEEDYHTVESFQPKRKQVQYRKIKRELVSPPRAAHTVNYNRTAPKSDNIEHVIVSAKKDEYSVFGEYIANKLRKFNTPRTRGNIQQLITTILWQAEYGVYDDPESVKHILMQPVQVETEQHNSEVEQETQYQTVETQREDINQSVESENLPLID